MNRRPKNTAKKGAEKPSAPRVWRKYVAPNALPPAFARKKKRKTRSPPCFAELWAPTPEQKPRTPREKGEKNEEKNGNKIMGAWKNRKTWQPKLGR